MHGKKAWRWVVEDLGQQAALAQAEPPLSWFFVIQHNDKPSHDSFLTEVAGFFDQTTMRNVRRDRTCLVFANSAGKPVPGRSDFYGGTSLVFSKRTLFENPECLPTFCSGGRRFRSSTLLSAYRDFLFRERGACVHSFVQVNPDSIIDGASGIGSCWMFSKTQRRLHRFKEQLMPSSPPDQIPDAGSLRNYPATVVPGAQLTDAEVNSEYPRVLLFQTKRILAAFAFSNGGVRKSYEALYGGFKSHFANQLGKWDAFDLAFVFCVRPGVPNLDRFCATVETDVYFCRKMAATWPIKGRRSFARQPERRPCPKH